MQLIALGTLVFLDNCEGVDEGNEENIEKVKESPISMKKGIL